MSDSDWQYGESRTPTPWGYWTGSGDAGAYWVEEPAPENAGYNQVVTGGGDAGSNISWEPVQPSSPSQPLDYGQWQAPAGAVNPGSAGIGADGLNALYREILGRDADASGIATFGGMSAADARRYLLDSAEYKARMGGSAGGGSTPFVPVNPSAPAGGGGRIGINPAAVLNTNLGTNPGLMPVNPYFQTTNDVQNQYSWAPRSEANPLAAGQQNWGIQQPNRGFDVNQFIAEMLGPQNQSQAAKLPTPYPGK
jgi:hypothetical protein